MDPKIEELLKMLAEEANEVSFIILKTLRHGLNSFHPDDPDIRNIDMIVDEIYDFLAVHKLLMDSGLLSNVDYDLVDHIAKKKLQYTYFQ